MARAGRSVQSPWQHSLFVWPDYCFEFVFERSRRNSERAKTGQAFGGRGVDLHEFDLITGKWWARQHLGNAGQCIPERKWHPALTLGAILRSEQWFATTPHKSRRGV